MIWHVQRADGTRVCGVDVPALPTVGLEFAVHPAARPGLCTEPERLYRVTSWELIAVEQYAVRDHVAVAVVRAEEVW